ncbi:TrkA family potassium uptake protein [Venenivibrio stagnispumantis]|uniref:Trk system potassium uptake protein TrkA n=1 Tax=Venenivibrio stagnispumantis TaxID=407998 RepID=A0AA46ADW6_9AQUI|nr:TrkA family potassium uptake protein [Venenivibrio stagnispumantis]MCW4573149.1 TrkA family potassium uptake protein [Venenivibrio stagnispumantis]SMP08464.1 trk system potassium uptake protein TrkA [Venenivibrio stagnispumantis]
MKEKRIFAVIGLGKFGFHVAKTLAERGMEVIAIDKDEDRVKEVSEFVTQTYILDATDEKALRESGIKAVDVAVVSVGENLEANLMIVMLLNELGIKEIVAKAINPLHGKMLEKLNVSRVIYPEMETAIRVANSLIAKEIIEEIYLTENYSIFEIKVPQFMVGKTLAELDLRKKYDINVLGVKRENSVIINPAGEFMLQDGDILIVLGNINNVMDLL